MESKVIVMYKQFLNLQDAEFEQIQHSDSIIAIAYKVLMPNGINLILKVCDQAQHFYKELYFLKYFARKLPIAKIINTVEPKPDVHGAILMECLAGDVLQTQDLTTSLSFEIGVLLAKIHTNKTTAFGDLTEANSMVQDPRIYFASKFEESFAECLDHLPNHLLQKCREYYEKNIDFLLAVDGPCIIHRDFRPGNIMVENNKVSGIIDWASGRAGFAEDDLCPLEMGEWGNDLEIKQAFLNGYASIRKIPDYSAVMPLLLLNRAIAIVGFTVKVATWDNRDTELYQRNKKTIEQILD